MTRERISNALIALWSGVLLAPVAFLVHLETNYALLTFVCSGGNLAPLWAASIATILLAGAGCLLAFRSWRKTGGEWTAEGHDPVSRNRFLAIWGFFMSLLFLGAIVAQAIPIFILDPCT